MDELKWSDMLKGKLPFEARRTIVQDMLELLLSGGTDLEGKIAAFSKTWRHKGAPNGREYERARG